MRSKVLVLIVVLGLAVCLPALAAEQVPEIDATTLNKWISDGKDLVLIDVGSRGDFAEAHISGSVSLPFDTSFRAETSKLSKVKTCVLVCPAGRRSLRAATVMMKSGFKNVYSLKGGITDWIRHGFKVVKGETKSSAPAVPTPTTPAGDSAAALKQSIITGASGFGVGERAGLIAASD
jgi:rhodanese-related sulfurtransferase